MVFTPSSEEKQWASKCRDAMDRREDSSEEIHEGDWYGGFGFGVFLFGYFLGVILVIFFCDINARSFILITFFVNNIWNFFIAEMKDASMDAFFFG